MHRAGGYPPGQEEVGARMADQAVRAGGGLGESARPVSLPIVQAEVPESGEIKNCDILPSGNGITGAGFWLSCPQDHNLL